MGVNTKHLIVLVNGCMTVSKRACLCMLFCLFPFIAIYSQMYVGGQVRGEDGMPVMGASVLLYNDSLLTPPMVAYSTTRQDGTFRIDTKKDKQTYWLVVRSLGYKDYKQEVTSGGEDFYIVLSEGNTMLSEVVVKGFYSGVKISGDTIKFDTKHLRNGFENSVSDLLTSLPGVSVTDDGSVSYGGDAVNKLLIDGKDLFTKDAGGYVLKNMAADLVDGAEIIKNYKAGNIGDRFSQKDQLALNIKTKGIGHISGRADLNYGYENRYNFRSFTMGTAEKFSFTSLLAGNNIGVPLFTIGEYIKRIIDIEDLSSGGSIRMTLSDTESSLFYRPDNVHKDLSDIMLFDAKYKFSKKLVLSGNVLLNHFSQAGRSHREDIFLSDLSVANTFSNNEQNGNFFIGKLKADWKPRDNVHTLMNVKFDATGMKDRNDARTDGGDITENAINNNKKTCAAEADISTKIGIGDGLFTTLANIRYNCWKRAMQLNTNKKILPVSYFLTPDNIYLYNDSMNTERLHAALFLGYSFVLKNNFKFETSVNYLYDTQELSLVRRNDMAENDERLDINELALKFYLKNDSHKMWYRIGAMLVSENNRYTSRFSNHSWAIYPLAEIGYKFNVFRNLSLSLTRGNELIDMEKLSGLNIVNTYNEISAGSGIMSPYNKSNKLMLSYQDYNVDKQLFFVVLANMSSGRNTIMQNIVQNNIVSITKYESGGTDDNVYFMTTIDKRFKRLPLTLKGTLSANYMKNASAINNKMNETKMYFFSSDLNVTTKFKSSFNFDLSMKYSHNRSVVSITDIRSDADKIDVVSKLLFRANNLRGQLQFGYYRVTGNGYKSNLYDLGCNIDYKINKLMLALTVKNILNLRETEWWNTVTTPYYTSTESYSRIPGYIMLGLVYNY